MPIYFRRTPVNEPFIFDCIGNHWVQERVLRPKGYPFYHYLQTEKGKGQITIQGKTYRLNEGEGILTAPFISHSYSKESEEWLTTFIAFTGTIERSISQMLRSRPLIFIEKETGIFIQNEIDSIIRKYETPPLDLHSISIDCYRLLMYFVDGIHTKDLTNDPLYQRYVAPVMKEIETHYNTILTVRELSEKVYITPQYLSRLFGRFLGCSVYEYLTTCRITHAKEFLLMDPKMEVQKIAEKVGFLDTSHFIAIFKKVTGFTPLGFRKAML